jgi:two-component system response regulator QseB
LSESDGGRQEPVRVLVVDDLPDNVEILRARLESRGYAVATAANGEEALAAVHADPPQLILCDVMMPGIDGYEVARRIKRDESLPFIPIILVTALSETEHVVQGLDAGADDYIVKPFHLDELAARLRAVHRRAQGNARNLVEAGALVLDTDSGEARWHGRPLPLSRTEFLLLRALAERGGRVVARDVLEQAMYGNDRVESNALEVHVHALRRKTSARAIRTVRGLGYLFAGTDEPA